MHRVVVTGMGAISCLVRAQGRRLDDVHGNGRDPSPGPARAALARWRDGERDVTFPYGTYWMVHFHGAQCERAPPR